MADNDSKKDPLEIKTVLEALLGKLEPKTDALDMSLMDYKSMKKMFSNIEDLSKSLKGLTGISTNTEASIKGMGEGMGLKAEYASKKLHKFGDEMLKSGNIVGGIFLKSIGVATSALSSMSTAILDESQKQAKTWHEFAEYGGIGVKGMKDISDQYPRTLLSLEKFQSTITGNADALAMYGGRISEGAKTFSEAQTILANTSTELRDLGFSVESMADATANYMSIQAKSAKQEKLRGADLANATEGYVKQLDLMSRLTGANNKELQKRQDEMLRESRYGAAVRTLERGGIDTQGTQSFVSALDKIAPDMAKGLRDALGGNYGTEQAKQAAIGLKGGLEPLLKMMREGADADDLMRQIQKQNTEEQRKFVDQMQARGGSTAFAESLGYELQRISNVGSVSEVEQEQKKAKEQEDKRTQSQVEMEKNVQQAAASKIEAETAFARHITGAADILAQGANLFWDATKFLAEFVGDESGKGDEVKAKIAAEEKRRLDISDEAVKQQKKSRTLNDLVGEGEADVIERKKSRTVADLSAPSIESIKAPEASAIPSSIDVDTKGLSSAVKQFKEGVDSYAKSTQRFQESSDQNEKSVNGQTRNGTPYGPITYQGKVINPGEPKYDQATEALKLSKGVPNTPQSRLNSAFSNLDQIQTPITYSELGGPTQTIQAPGIKPMGRPWAQGSDKPTSEELNTTSILTELPQINNEILKTLNLYLPPIPTINTSVKTTNLILNNMYEWMIRFQREFRIANNLNDQGEKKNILESMWDNTFGTSSDSGGGSSGGGGVVDTVKRFFGFGGDEGPQTVEQPSEGGGPSTVGVKGLLDRIAQGEGTSDETAKKHGLASGYDVSLGYGKYAKGSKPISQMTFAEISQLQSKMLASGASSTAVGKYQFIRKTLDGLKKKFKVKDTDVFTPEMQDKFGEELLKQRGLDSYQSGKISAAKFQTNLAKEWASVATAETGRSYYGQHTGTSSSEIQRAISGLSDKTSLPNPQNAGKQTAREAGYSAGPQTMAPTSKGQMAADIAKSHLGQGEGKAGRSKAELNPWLNKYAGNKSDVDLVAWCARFVSASLEQAGIKSTKNASAGSYKNWGQEVDPKDARAGDVVLIPAKTASGYHVMMSQGIDPTTGKLKIIGGNQGKGEVSERSYDLNKKGMIVRRANELMNAGPPEKAAARLQERSERSNRAEELKQKGKDAASAKANIAPEMVGPPTPSYAQPTSPDFVGPQTMTDLSESPEAEAAPSMPNTIQAGSLNINAGSVNVSGNQVANQEEKTKGEQQNQTLDKLNTIPEGFGSTPIVPASYTPNTVMPSDLSMNFMPPVGNDFMPNQTSRIGFNQPLIANQSIGNDAAMMNQRYSNPNMIDASSMTDWGSILGGVFGSVTGNGPYRTRTPGRGSIGYGLGGLGEVLGGTIGSMKGLGGFGPVLGSVVTGMGRGLGGMVGRSVTGTGYQTVQNNSLGLPTGIGGPAINGPDVLTGLGGMAGNMIGGTINGAAQGVGGLFTGLSSMLGMGSSNLTAPESTKAPLEATPPQPKPAQEPTGAISPSDGNTNNEMLVSLMNTQIDQLSSLNSMTRKLNSTAEQILKSQK